MTTAPKTLTNLQKRLVKNLHTKNLGIVGNAAHIRNGGYHNGAKSLRKRGMSRDYSLEFYLDSHSTSDYACAIDIGGSPKLLMLLGNRIVHALKNHDPRVYGKVRGVNAPFDGHSIDRRYDTENPKTPKDDNTQKSSDRNHIHLEVYRTLVTNQKVIDGIYDVLAGVPLKKPAPKKPAPKKPAPKPATNVSKGMDAATLCKVMTISGHHVTYSKTLNKIYFDKANGGPSFKATDWMAALNTAMLRAGITNSKRAAMWFAQLGEESGSFRYTQELASGSEYNGRKDLGNTHAGDGPRFKGRTYIQITGRSNYARLSKWAHSKGYVPTSTYFVDHPTELANVKYIFLGPVWYWTVARNMNKYADANDIVGATKAVNGGTNGLSDRKHRWEHARTFGNALLPSGIKPVASHAAPAPKKPSPKPTPKKKPSNMYTVRRGDTLTSIAKKYHVKGGWLTLKKWNNIARPNKIKIGQRLRVR